MGAHFVPLREQRLRRREQEEMAPLDKWKRSELNREEEPCKQEVLEADRKRPEDERRERHEAAEPRHKVPERLLEGKSELDREVRREDQRRQVEQGRRDRQENVDRKREEKRRQMHERKK